MQGAHGSAALRLGQRACPRDRLAPAGTALATVEPRLFKETAMPDDRSDDERQRDYEQIKQDLT